MNRRFVVVASAALLAGLVLTASIVFGPPMLDGQSLEIDPDIGAATGNTARDVTYTIIQRGEADGDITRTVLKAERLQRLDRGVSRLTRPRAEMRYSPTRAMTLSGDSADVIMVDNQPQRGTFTGNVVITLFECDPGQTLITDVTDPRHRTFVSQQVFIDDDDTDFDLATNDIDTDGTVHVTSREVDFFGQGLRLKYNTRRKRIEQLVITEGRYLMFNPEAELEQSADPEDPVDPAEQTEPTEPIERAPSQYYLASFRENVLVREGDRSELFGDETLDIRFSLGREAVTPADPLVPGENARPKPEQDNALGRLLPAIPGWQLAQAGDGSASDVDPTGLPVPEGGVPGLDANGPVGPGTPENAGGGEIDGEPGQPVPPALAQPVTIPAKNLARTMFDHDPARDVVVTWSGQLRLTPLSRKPAVLVDDEDVHFRLVGQNAYAQTTRDDRTDRIDAAEIQYRLATQLVNAIAPDGQPIRITSSTLGQLEGTRLTVNQQEGIGTIEGPGTLTQLPDDQGKSLTLTWTDRLDLELYTETVVAEDVVEDSADAAASGSDSPLRGRPGQVRVTGLKTATFRGDVSADHPDFDLRAGQLTLAFREPNDATGTKNDPMQINAADDVAVNARGDAEDERFAIAAQGLTIDLATDEQGDLYATSMRALLDVKIERPGSVLHCRRVDVSLAPPDPAAKAEAQEGDASRKAYAEVRSLVATGDVQAELDYDGRRVNLAADQLIGDVERDQLTLIANDDRNLAEVFDVDDNRRLSGKKIVMDDQAERVRVDGPGALFAALTDPDLADAALAVTWDKSMRFDNVASEAFFVGDVNATSRRSTDQSELTADELDLRFSPDPEHDPQRLVEPPFELPAQPGEQDREIRSTVARGNVKLVAAAFAPNEPNRPYNRVRIEGPELTFTNRPRTSPATGPIETLVVEGVGLMQIEDYRDREEQGAADEPARPDRNAPDNNGDASVAFTGRGATLFIWQEGMKLDARANTATFIEDVQMVHRPREDDGGEGEVVQLDCQQLIADMEDGGGLGVWMSDAAPDARITAVTADENVRLTRGPRELRGDHLKYTAATALAELWADEGKQVLVNDLETDTLARAERAIWDLTRDRIELQGAQGGATPTR